MTLKTTALAAAAAIFTGSGAIAAEPINLLTFAATATNPVAETVTQTPVASAQAEATIGAAADVAPQAVDPDTVGGPAGIGDDDIARIIFASTSNAQPVKTIDVGCVYSAFLPLRRQILSPVPCEDEKLYQLPNGLITKQAPKQAIARDDLSNDI